MLVKENGNNTMKQQSSHNPQFEVCLWKLTIWRAMLPPQESGHPTLQHKTEG